MFAHPALGDIGQLFVLLETFDVQQSMVWIDGASVSLTGWPRVYMARQKRRTRILRSDLAHKHGLWGQIAVE